MRRREFVVLLGWAMASPSGSYDIARLGASASHGCIRLRPNDTTVLAGHITPSTLLL